MQQLANERAAQDEKQHVEQQARDQFAITLVCAQLVSGLFDSTKPLPHYMNPMLEQLKPYGKRADGNGLVMSAQPFELTWQ